MNASRLTVGSCLPAVLLTGAALCATADAPLGSAPAARHTAQQPVFKGRIDLVRHDVTVIDNRTGKAVTGLTRDDFTISENGERQKIETFLADSSIRAGAASEDASKDRRVFLIIFGTGRLEGPVDPFDGAIRFLRERLRPNDLVSVMAFNRATPFTPDHELMARVVERRKQETDALWLALLDDAKKSGFQNVDLSSAAQAAIDDVFRPARAAGPLQNVATLLLGSPVPRDNVGRWRPWNRLIVERDLLKVYAGIEHLRGLDGSKHLISLTRSGFTLPVRMADEGRSMLLASDEDDRRLARRANDAEVALHTIHTSGTSSGLFMSMTASQNVAAQTGGQATSLHTAEEALARIDEATRGGYLLGYVPSNPVFDGTYRNVSVTVNRRNVTLLHRRGYTARAEAPPPDVRELITRQRLRDAAAVGLVQNDIRIQASASRARGPDGTLQARIQIVIDASQLSLIRAGDKHQGVIDLLILCGDGAGNVVGKLDQQMTLDLDEARYRRAMASGIPYTTVVPIARTAVRAKVLVYDYGADRLGAVDVRVK